MLKARKSLKDRTRVAASLVCEQTSKTMALADARILPCAEESLDKCVAKMPADRKMSRESATAVRVRKSSGNKKLLPVVPKLSHRATQISGVPVSALRNTGKPQEPDMTNHAHSGERDWQSDASSAVAWLLAGFAIGAATAL